MRASGEAVCRVKKVVRKAAGTVTVVRASTAWERAVITSCSG